MSRIAEYRTLEQELTRRLAELESFKDDPSFQKEIDFETRLRSLLAEYGYSLREVLAILDPDGHTQLEGPSIVAGKASRRARKLKVYRNPLTGELVQSKGGNNKVLGGWKAQFGPEEVESWVQN